MSGGNPACNSELTVIDLANFLQLPTLDEDLLGKPLQDYTRVESDLSASYDYSFVFGSTYCTQATSILYQDVGHDTCDVMGWMIEPAGLLSGKKYSLLNG